MSPCRQVVTPHGVLSAAVHVAGGRIQAVVPCDKPPRNTKVRARAPRRAAVSFSSMLRRSCPLTNRSNSTDKPNGSPG